VSALCEVVDILRGGEYIMIFIQPAGATTVGGIMEVLYANPYVPTEGEMLVLGLCTQTCDEGPIKNSRRARLWLSYGESISLLPAEYLRLSAVAWVEKEVARL
jgi:hypothetical protein